MTDEPVAPPMRRQQEPGGSGSWIPLVGSAAILGLLLALVITAQVLNG
jgi:hypothetical protein